MRTARGQNITGSDSSARNSRHIRGIVTRVQVSCRDGSSRPRMLRWPLYQLLPDRKKTTCACFFAGRSLWEYLCCEGSPLLCPCIPVHPCVGGIFLLGEPWSNASCESQHSNVLSSRVFICAHNPNGKRRTNVKICMEITWKSWWGRFLPLLEGNWSRLVLVVLCDDCDPHYLQRFIHSNIRDPIRDPWWAPGLPVGSLHSPLFHWLTLNRCRFNTGSQRKFTFHKLW